MKTNKGLREDDARGDIIDLPEAIAAQVKECVNSFGSENGKSVKYLWIYVTDDGRSDRKDTEKRETLTIDEWLSVIDEGSSLGARYLVIGLGAPLSRHPEVTEICRWAQAAHDMVVGLHLHKEPLTLPEIQQIKELDPARLRIFVDRDHMDAMRLAREMGLTLYEADSYESVTRGTSCTLPNDITCIGARGDLYTCGFVLGEQQYNLGHFFERRLDQIMADEALPHEVYHSADSPRRKCGGCPPRLAGLMHQEKPR